MHWLITYASLFILATAGLMLGVAVGPESKVLEKFAFPTNYRDFKQQVELVGNYSFDHAWYVYSMLWATQVYWKSFGIPGIRTLRLVSGALFGILPAMALSVSANAVGALIAYLISDTVLREYLETAFPERIAYLKDRANRYRDDLFYFLLSLTMTPGFTQTFASFAAPIIDVPLVTHIAASTIGSIPNVYVASASGRMLTEFKNTGFFSLSNLVQTASVAAVALLPKMIELYLNRTYPDHAVLYRPRASYKVNDPSVNPRDLRAVGVRDVD